MRTDHEPAQIQVQELLAQLASQIANGQVRPEAMRVLGNQQLYGGVKNDDNPNDIKYRPIAMVGDIRKMVEWLIEQVIGKGKKIEDMFEHMQFGIRKGGMEKVVNMVKYGLGNNNTADTIKLDAQNGFNMINRKRMIQQVKIHFPMMYKYVLGIYGATNYMFVSGFNDNSKSNDAVLKSFFLQNTKGKLPRLIQRLIRLK